MKTIYILFLILLLNLTSAFSQWNIQYTPATAQTSMCIRFFNDNTGYYSGTLYNASTYNIYKTTNGGLNFVSQNSYLTAQRFMSIFMIHPDTVFICGNYGKILRTFNGGNNWSMFVYSDTLIQFWGLYFVNSNTGFATGSAGKILKTTNKGDTWNLLSSPTPSALDGIYFVNENTGYIGGSGSGILIKTTDAGATFVNKNGLYISGFETATSVYFSDANNGMYCTNAGRIVQTTNGGDNWSLIYSMTGGIWGLSFPNSTTGFACTSVGTVLKTTNFGTNWGIQNTPLTSSAENLYEIYLSSAQTGYISTWSGKVLKTTNGGLTFASGKSTNVPDKFVLHQNYPNPFNPNTIIKFRIPRMSSRDALARDLVRLKVYDILGKEVLTLVNERLQAGEYDVTFDGSNYPSGIYFYKLSAGNFSETKKMLMVK